VEYYFSAFDTGRLEMDAGRRCPDHSFFLAVSSSALVRFIRSIRYSYCVFPPVSGGSNIRCLSYSHTPPVRGGFEGGVSEKSGLVERVPGYGIFLTERILDFIVVVLMAVLSMVFGVSRFLDIQTVLAAVAILLICFFVFVLMVRRLSPASSWGRFFQPFRQCIRSGRLLAIAVTLTVVGWLFIVLGWYASLRSIAVSVSLVETTAMMTVTTLIGLLSLIPWSLGISEVSIVSFLIYFKQEIPLAQTGALMIRLYGMVTLVLGLIHFVVWKWMDLIRKNR